MKPRTIVYADSLGDFTRVNRDRLLARKGGHRAEDQPLCQHGIAMRRCDECGVFIAAHAGAVHHVCGEQRASCADDVPRTADGRVAS